MADATKAQRLLAAKKLVKEYQKNKKSKSTDSKTPADSLTNSTHSSLNDAPNIEETEQFQSHSASPLQQYFSGNASQPSDVNFFDSIPKQDNTEFDNFNQVNLKEVPITTEPDSVSYEDPEIKPMSEILGDKREGSMESLKQLSTQIIQLIDDNSVSDGVLKNNVELESKYKEALELLKDERNVNDELRKEIISYQIKLRDLEKIEGVKLGENERKNYLEEIERNEQTVKFLVAEKSDLEKIVFQRDAELKHKKSECDELNARLKTSRSRVADLERELNNLKESKLKNNVPLEQNEKYIQLTNDYSALKTKTDEMLQDLSETQQKLQSTSEDNSKLRSEIQDLNSQISMLNVKLTQVSSGNDSQTNYQIENLSIQLQTYEKQISDLNSYINALTMEKEQTAVHYQQYVQQLNSQLNNISQKFEEKVKENEALIGRECDLTNQMGQLEKILQDLQRAQPEKLHNIDNPELQDDSFRIHTDKLHNGIDVAELRETLNKLEEEKKQLEETYESIKSERDEGFKELELKRDEIMQLEDMVSHLKSNQPDSVKLLAEIESEKVAASRAVAQNEELKSQLVEMQNAFIKISNEKLELAEKWSDALHKSKEAEDHLANLESQIHTLTDAIAIKDREMYSLRESAAEANRYMVQQNQLEDRLRHYEARDHSTHALQHELQQAYLKLQTITTENNSLKLNMKNLEGKYNKIINDKPETDNQKELLRKIEELENKLANAQINSEQSALVNGEINGMENDGISKEVAMKHLEEKFTKMMEEIANLEDEKQRLEHLVLQLQDETETIGEYVTLYQHQRGVLKQRTSEKEEQMKQLQRDRENMRQKIDQLNNLINRLMIEKGDVALEAITHQAVDKSQLCLEHAKVHQAMESNSAKQEFNNNTKTAEKIMELLGEIKTSSLVQPSEMSEAFHPCPWCSGQLITV